jgi:hypothetical protein
MTPPGLIKTAACYDTQPLHSIPPLIASAEDGGPWLHWRAATRVRGPARLATERLRHDASVGIGHDRFARSSEPSSKASGWNGSASRDGAGQGSPSTGPSQLATEAMQVVSTTGDFSLLTIELGVDERDGVNP